MKFISTLFSRKASTDKIVSKFKEMYNNEGCFDYSTDGFTFRHQDFTKSLKWDEITELIAYKTDQITIDRVEMDIVYEDAYFTISEQLPGWYQFIVKTKEIFPSITNDWDDKILFPIFAENRTVIYSKGTTFRGSASASN